MHRAPHVEALMDALQKELEQLENRYWQAIKDKDVEAALRLTDEPCIVAGAQGVASIDAKTYGAMMQKAKWSLKSFAITDVKVKPLGNDAAIVAYKVHEDLEVEGKPLSLDASDSSVWVKRDGSWKCALHTESLKGDPFGRDKQS